MPSLWCRLAIIFALLFTVRSEAQVRTRAVAAATVHSVVLTWLASADAGVAYNVYRLAGTCPSSGTAGFTLLASAVTALTYTDTTVTVGSSFCYYATATLNGLESVPSNLAPAVIIPAPPTSLMAGAH